MELEFIFDADWYDSNEDQYEWVVTGYYTPEVPERINCLPEDATPHEGSIFEITSVELHGGEGGPPQADIDKHLAGILDAADKEFLEGSE